MTQPSPQPGRAAEDLDVLLRDVVLRFGDRPVLRGVGCGFGSGRISVILGGSGTGKTTLLRVIGGLVRPLSGSVRVLGREVTRLSERELYGVRSRLGMMFQNGALLDSMTVFENLALPLREHASLRPIQIRERVRSTLDSVGLDGVEELLPRQLSGGMVKRVALARSLIHGPRVLLCDEPFSGLDPISSRRIEDLLVRINREQGITIIAVSHDVVSTRRMAAHVVLMFPEVTYEGSPEELLRNPDPRVAAFLEPDAEIAPEAEVEVVSPGGGRVE